MNRVKGVVVVELARPASHLDAGPRARRLARRVIVAAYLLLVVLLTAGCQKLFGDYTVVETSGSTCAPRAYQCVGNVLQQCNGEGSVWLNAMPCASEALCDAVRGVCIQPTCSASTRKCVGAELQGCNAARNGWTLLATCSTAGHCSAESGTCTEQPCEPGSTQCNGPVVQTCKADRSGWDDTFTCASAALCNSAQGACTGQTCEPGDFDCQGSVLRACNEGLDGWTPVRSCDSDILCNEMAGTCGDVVCTTPGAFRCDATGLLERCADDLTGWLTVGKCESVAHCDALKGGCNERPCNPGDQQCNGSVLQRCNADSSGWDEVDTCQTDGLCQQALSAGETRCREPACAAGVFRCEGAQPQVCNAALTDFRDNGAPCLTAELCNPATGACALPVCDPGETRCNGAEPEICNPGRTGFVPHGAPCASVTLCRAETGTCGDVACLAGQKRCNPAAPTELQLCNATLDGWDDCATCATAALCSDSLDAETCGPGACTAPTCALGDRWCGGANNRTLFQCPASRINTQPDVVDVCETAGLCEATRTQPARPTCVEKSCNLEDRWCGGAGNRVLQKCPPSLINSQAMVLDTCETAGLCAQAHADPDAVTCPDPACAASGYSCGGEGSAILQFCNADRTELETCDTCDSAALCTASLNATACNEMACDTCLAGTKECAGAVLRICNAGGTAVTSVTCGSAELCTASLTPANQTTCDACLAGSFDCDGAQPLRCNAPANGPAVWVENGEPCEDEDACDAATGTCEVIGAGGVPG